MTDLTLLNKTRTVHYVSVTNYKIYIVQLVCSVDVTLHHVLTKYPVTQFVNRPNKLKKSHDLNFYTYSRSSVKVRSLQQKILGQKRCCELSSVTMHEAQLTHF